MTINEEIYILANKLANQGKKPTVALIKSKLSQPVPLPTIIRALKSWQHDPDFIEAKENIKSNHSIKDENLLLLTEKQLNQKILQIIEKVTTPLQQEINILKEKLNLPEK